MTPEDLRNLSPEEQLYGAVYLAATFGPHLYQLAPIVASIKPADIRPVFDAALAVKDAIDDFTLLVSAMHNVVPT